MRLPWFRATTFGFVFLIGLFSFSFTCRDNTASRKFSLSFFKNPYLYAWLKRYLRLVGYYCAGSAGRIERSVTFPDRFKKLRQSSQNVSQVQVLVGTIHVSGCYGRGSSPTVREGLVVSPLPLEESVRGGPIKMQSSRSDFGRSQWPYTIEVRSSE